jgi:hypothetical protein
MSVDIDNHIGVPPGITFIFGQLVKQVEIGSARS